VRVVSSNHPGRHSERDCAVCAVLRDAVPAVALRCPLRAVTLEKLAAEAGVRADVAAQHVRDGPDGIISAGYAHAAEDLFRCCVAGFEGAETWLAGLEAAIHAVLRRISRDPTIAHFCFEAVLAGNRSLLELRERRRQRLVRFLAEEHRRRSVPGEPLPTIQFEFVAAGLVRAIADIVHAGRLDQRTGDLTREVLEAVQVFQPGGAGWPGEDEQLLGLPAMD
jgi:hypothetical protein